MPLSMARAAPRDAIDQHLHRRAQIDQQRGRRQRLHDQVVQSQIGRIIALAQVAHLVQRARENVRVLVDRAIDDGAARIERQLPVLRGAMPQEENLQVKRPAAHVAVEVAQIRIVGHRFITGVPVQARGQPLRQTGLARADVARDQHEMFGHDRLLFNLPEALASGGMLQKGLYMNPTNNQTRAVLWDMDGTLIDSMPYHVEAWTEVLEPLGYHFAPEQLLKDLWPAQRARSCATISNSIGRRPKLQRLIEEKEERYRGW